MSFVARSSTCSLGLRLSALCALAWGTAACAPKFNFNSLQANRIVYEGDLQITSPDQNGKKISYLAQTAVPVSGTCSAPGWIVTISGDASGTTTCQSNGTWSLTLDFSSAADGTLTISGAESSGSDESLPVTRVFDKETAYCSAHFGDSPYAGGSGTSGDPYIICSAAQLVHLSNTSTDWGSYFQMQNDIDLSGQTWTPINLTGTFDGNGFVASNLTVNTSASNDVGFFGSLSGTVRNIGVTGGSMTGNISVGLVAGAISGGTITNCYSTGTVTSVGYHAGGLVGDGFGTISDSWSSATVTILGSGGGGLIGDISGGSISKSYATGSVNITGGGNSREGGLAGASSVAISDCYATGAVHASGDSEVGGLVGLSSSTITDSYATGAVVGSSQVGGLIGNSSGSAAQSYWDITTTGQSSSAGGTGLTDAQIQVQSNLTGFDFTTPTWTWNPYISSYPVLEYQ